MWNLEFQQLLVVAMWDLVPWSGIEPGPPALGVWSLSHWTTKKSHEGLFWPLASCLGWPVGTLTRNWKEGCLCLQHPAWCGSCLQLVVSFCPRSQLLSGGPLRTHLCSSRRGGNQNSHFSCPEVLHHPCGLPAHCSTFVNSLFFFFFNLSIVDLKYYVSSPVWLFATPWTAAHQAPPSMGFSRQEYWSGVLLPSWLYLLLLLIYPSFPSLSPLVT